MAGRKRRLLPYHSTKPKALLEFWELPRKQGSGTQKDSRSRQGRSPTIISLDSVWLMRLAELNGWISPSGLAVR